MWRYSFETSAHHLLDFLRSQVLPLPLHLVQSHFLYYPTTITHKDTPSCKIPYSSTPTAITSSVCLLTDPPQCPSYSPLPQVITIISNAIICSAAAWNLPISQNANLHSTSACNDEKKGIPR
jgi:hypothetical protein